MDIRGFVSALCLHDLWWLRKAKLLLTAVRVPKTLGFGNENNLMGNDETVQLYVQAIKSDQKHYGGETHI